MSKSSVGDFGTPDQGKGKFSQGKEEPERFYPEEKSLFSYRDAFFLLITAWPTMRKLDSIESGFF